ncbi:MAG: hypothetical protein KA129_01315 [Microthrixaceae bacterium]|nr:hypothetical protein [Microthrixaceae bacterium]
MTYNANVPGTIGNEWAPSTEGVTPLTTPTTVAAWRVASSVTETISTIYVPHTWTGPSSGYGKLVVDVYDLSDTGAGTALTSTSYQPNEDDAEFNVYAPNPTWTSVSVGSTYTKVDEVTATDSDYLAFPNTAYARMAFNTSGFTGQPVSVTFKVRAFGYYGTTGNVEVALYNNTTWVATLGSLRPPAGGDDSRLNFVTYEFGPFTTNPLTGVAWAAADITGFDTGSNLMLNFYAYSGNVAISWVSMVVQSGTDKRVATGSTATQTSLPSGVQTNLPVTLAANWSKVSGTDYLIVARRLDDPAGLAATMVPQPMYLGTDACPHVHGQSYSATVESSGLLASSGSVDTSKTYGFWLGTSGGAISANSQPYYDIDAVLCTTANNIYQDLVGATNVPAYKVVTATIAVDATAMPTSSLTVVVKRTSDNVQMGGSATLAVADLTNPEIATLIGTRTLAGESLTLYRVRLPLSSSATLAAATEYYTSWTSSTPVATPWYFPWLVGTAAHSLTGDATYGGTGVVGWNGGVSSETSTHMQTFASVPAAATSITVTNTATTINGVSIDYAAISWVSGASLTTAFSRWEVERSEDAGTTWTQIATIATEATVSFADYEGKRANANKYRVRVVRTDAAKSDYTTQSGTVTPSASSSAKAIFTTNSDSALTVGYTPHGVEMLFEDLTAAETVFVRLHDRDYQASFRPLESRGIRWPFTAQVHTSTSTPSAGAGVRAYDALRAIATDPDAPYLCLHTADGERFFGALQVGQFRRMLDGTGAYFAECVFTETQGDSSAVAL